MLRRGPGRALWRALQRGRRDRGVVAVLTGIMSLVFIMMAAFAIDVSRWYLAAEQAQRAADAAALAGVTSLPSDTTTAFSTAQTIAGVNGFPNGATSTVTASVGSKPSQLVVSVTTKVSNLFAGVMGVPTTNVTRTATADFASPVSMGSPCNEFGNDPSSDNVAATTCSANGQFWANVGSPAANKSYGDAYQDAACSSEDGCSGGTNTDYSQNGYFYTVTLSRAVANLRLEAFDPAFVSVGDTCTANGLNGPTNSLYAPGPSSPYCTGDALYNSTPPTTQFTVRQPSSGSMVWDPTTYPPVTGCTTQFPGYNQSLANIQNNNWAGSDPTKQAIKSVFRQWVPLCTLSSAPPGTYFIQVKTNGLGNDGAAGHNRFALRAYSTSDGTASSAISIAGNQRMGIYANLPSATASFYLARVPTVSAGRYLTISLFDIGDSNQSGQVTVVDPQGNVPTGCTGTGVVSGPLSTCGVTANSSFNGRWQYILVPVPTTYSCTDSDPTKCWYRLKYNYGSGSQPSDTTSWAASIAGDPVRLIQ